MPKLPNQEAFDKAIGYLQECQDYHSELIRGVEKRYRSYRGIVDQLSDAASWQSQLYPPYIMHIVETTLASLVDHDLRYRVRPRATLESYLDPLAAQKAREGAEAHQILSDWQMSRSNFSAQERPFVLQNAIAGITVAKNMWLTREERRRHMIAEQEPILDEYGDPLISPTTGQPMMVTRMREEVKQTVVYDGPITETGDIHDFMWHQAAPSIDKARYLIDRVWVNAEDIWKGFGEDALWGPERGGWPEKEVRKQLGTSGDGFKDEYQNRWDEQKRDHTKDQVEVLEVWDTVFNTVTTIANRKALLSHKTKFPFFFESPPFVVCSTQPDLFRIVGISQVEKVEALQEMLWSIANQRIDNLRLINNAIFFFRPDLEDPSAYEFYPGARWPMEDPQQVGMFAPNPIPAEVSIGSEALLKGDMQNMGGSYPFSSGTDSQYVDQKTATGASLVTSIAQRSIDLAKKSVYDAWQKVGQQRLILNQQFIRQPTLAPVFNDDGEEEPRLIDPELLPGDFDFEIEAMPDALAKEQEQASAQALMQLFLSAAGPVAALASQGQATMINLDAVIEDVLTSHGKRDLKRYFKAAPPAVIPPAPGGAQGGPALPGEAPLGVTGEGSIDPAVSPSSGISLSPAAARQRALALSRGGGPRNI